jgi:hypothetical protein
VAIFSGRWTVEDEELGHCTVFRGSLPIAGVLAGIGLAMLVLFGSASWRNNYWNPGGIFTLALLPSVFWALALQYWRTELLVGANGFRLERPWRPFQVPLKMAWSQVSGSVVGSQTDRRGTKAWLIVTRTGGEKITISQQYSATFWEICDAMETSRKAALAALGADSQDASPS